MNDVNNELKDGISERYKELSMSWSSLVKERLKFTNESNTEYQKLEQHRVITIVYGTALANVLAIFNLEKDPNIIFYISALIWILSSYMTWFYSIKFIFQSHQCLREIVFLEDSLQNYKDGLYIHHDSLECNKERLIKFSQSTDQQWIEHLKNEHLRIQKNIDDDENNINKLPKMIAELKNIKMINDRIANQFYYFYMPTLVISWLLSFTGLLLSTYLNLIYLDKVWGWTMFGFSAVIVLVLWGIFIRKDQNMKSKLKEFEAIFNQ